MISFSKAAIHSNYFNYFKRYETTGTCPNAMLTATSEDDINGQMTFYQDSYGDLWLTGVYQSGFKDPSSWLYCWTIENGCGDILYNLTSKLDVEYVKVSECNGYSSNSNKKDFNKRNGKSDNCESWGTKPWVIKVDGLTWDCDNKGIKYKECDSKDYKDNSTNNGDEEKPSKGLKDQGPPTGLYLVINGINKSGKRTSSISIADINLNECETESSSKSSQEPSTKQPSSTPVTVTHYITPTPTRVTVTVTHYITPAPTPAETVMKTITHYITATRR